jgi:uroporphyrinogen decarboxylase
MKKETMSPRERWLAVLKRKAPDRVPMDYWGTPEISKKVMARLGVSTPEEMDQKLHIDRPLTVVPRPKDPSIGNIWGLQFKSVDYGTGIYDECVSHPLAGYETKGEIEKNYVFPTADLFDYTVIREQIKGREHRPIRGGGSEPFLTYKQLRGEEQAFMDLLLNPDIVHYCLGKMYDFCYENTRRIYEQIPGQVMLSYVAEDMGAQENLMVSPAQIREFFLPHMKRMTGLVHQNNAFAFHHNDGAIRDIIPALIETGIDVLNPIQWRCRGMERVGLKKDFGSRLIFHGGVDNQFTLPFGTVSDVRKEVEENLSVLGRNGGYILAPCHNLQAVSPVENILTLYETGYELGWN